MSNAIFFNFDILIDINKKNQQKHLLSFFL